MATWKPALGSCAGRMTAGERSAAERAQDKCMLWYGVSVGSAQSHPDFTGLQLRRGSLVLGVKDVRRSTTILRADYRNTRQILQTTISIACISLTPKERDAFPVVAPPGLWRLRSWFSR
jgi:hypothetical protein